MKHNIRQILHFSGSVFNVVLITAIASLTATSCVRDSFERIKTIFSDGTIQYEVSSDGQTANAGTKSDNGTAPILLVSDHNDTLYMYVSRTLNTDMGLCGSSATTKGKPITSSNISTEYAKFSVTAFNTGTTGTPFLSDEAEYDSDKQTWSTDPQYNWPNNQSLDFYAYAPVNITGLSNITYITGGGKIGFSYSLPSGSQKSGDNYIDAKNQKDLLFAITTNCSDKTAQGKVSFNFKHALSAIRFIGGSVIGAGTLQTITLKNLSSSGDATFDGSNSKFIWSNLNTQNQTYIQTFNVDLAEQSTPQDITDSDDATTFMMIPQTIDGSTSLLELSYLKDGTSSPVTFKAVIPAIEWESGYTYTYKLSIDSETVRVEVDDDVNNNEKDNLVVANAGTSDAYIRVALAGCWVNESDEIVFAWDETQGTFQDFPGTNWVKGSDGYYYYTYPVDGIVSDPVETGYKLFTKYTAPVPPYEDAHLEMDIDVQAVKYDVSKSNVTSAWGAEAASLLNTK